MFCYSFSVDTVLVTLGTGCKAATAAETTAAAETIATVAEKPQYKKFIVGTMPKTMGVPFQYAFENGYFKELGLDIEEIIFPTGAPINEAVAAKKIDVAVSGLASIFSLAIGNS
ncbi:MAG: ABC transporter substrate-binding protein [Candidatus Humimicrobiaceae bacterium]